MTTVPTDAVNQSTALSTTTQSTIPPWATLSALVSPLPPTPASSDLTTIVILVIGISAPIGVVSFFLLGIYFWRRRWRKQRTPSAEELDSHEMTELEGSRRDHELSETYREVEMDVEGARHEMSTADRIQELEIGKPRQELSSGEVAQGV